jgi:molybdate transport system substrate-binding protein
MNRHRGIALVLLVFGCTREAMPVRQDSKMSQAAEGPATVIAFVAASAGDAVAEIGDAFQKAHGVRVKINADDSAKLAVQIMHDAPAGIYLSANEKWADYLKDKGLIGASRNLLGNTLVLVVPKGNPAGVKSPGDLGKSEVTRIALAGPAVPAGIYAHQAFKQLGLWDTLEASKKIVSGDNVRVTLAYVERGEADAGVVYATDARISSKVQVVYTFDPATHDAIRYPLVLLTEGTIESTARSFYEYMQGAEAFQVFRKYGFTILDGK